MHKMKRLLLETPSLGVGHASVLLNGNSATDSVGAGMSLWLSGRKIWELGPCFYKAPNLLTNFWTNWVIGNTSVPCLLRSLSGALESTAPPEPLHWLNVGLRRHGDGRAGLALSQLFGTSLRARCYHVLFILFPCFFGVYDSSPRSISIALKWLTWM